MPWKRRKTGTAKQRGKAFKTSDKGGYPRHVIKLRRKIPEEWKKVPNDEFVYGDFDQDKTPNLDDIKPFDPAVTEQAEETNRKDQLVSIKRNNRRYREAVQQIEKAEGGTSRIKSEWSTLAKLRRKYIQNVQDIGGVKILVDTTKQVYAKAEEIKKKYKVLIEDDYYKNPLQGYYYAYHVTVEKNGFPVEIQIKTKGMDKLEGITHPYYKKGKKGPIEKFRRIARETLEKESG